MMPAPAREYLVNYTSNNVDDVTATFRDTYSVDALRRLTVPTLVAYGARSPETMVKIVQAIAALVPEGTLAAEQPDRVVGPIPRFLPEWMMALHAPAR